MRPFPPNSPREIKRRLADVRAKMAQAKIDALYLLITDRFQSEFPAAAGNRVQKLIGFSGSAGMVGSQFRPGLVLTHDRAALFVDGRYDLEAHLQFDRTEIEVCVVPAKTAEQWLAERLAPLRALAVDTWQVTDAEHQRLAAVLAKTGGRLTQIPAPILAALDGPEAEASAARAFLQPPSIAGQTARQKIRRAAKAIGLGRSDLYVCSLPEDLAWLTNLRGFDTPYLPAVHAFGLLTGGSRLHLFVASERVRAVRSLLKSASAEVADLAALPGRIRRLARRPGRTFLDPEQTPAAAVRLVRASPGARVITVRNPIPLLRAQKTDAEIRAIRRAHVLDGIAVTQLLHALETGALPRRSTEEDIGRELERLHRRSRAYLGPSFPWIVAFDGNAAIIHYRPGEDRAKSLGNSKMLLLDTGAHYLGGTTDITRTVAIARPSAELRKAYTLVLQAHIRLALQRFPKAVTGAQLDGITRSSLWQEGYDYAHGTGHGVGCFLGIHEGPQTISSRAAADVPFRPGMVLSNEPGYYLKGRFGIRIENLVAVGALQDAPDWLGFETLTLAPYDARLIDRRRLGPAERQWLRRYHAFVQRRLGPQLRRSVRSWLRNKIREF